MGGNVRYNNTFDSKLANAESSKPYFYVSRFTACPDLSGHHALDANS